MVVSDCIANLDVGFGNVKHVLPFSLTSGNLLLVTFFFFSSKSSLYNFKNFSLKNQNDRSMQSN